MLLANSMKSLMQRCFEYVNWIVSEKPHRRCRDKRSTKRDPVSHPNLAEFKDTMKFEFRCVSGSTILLDSIFHLDRLVIQMERFRQFHPKTIASYALARWCQVDSILSGYALLAIMRYLNQELSETSTTSEAELLHDGVRNIGEDQEHWLQFIDRHYSS